MGPYGIEIPIVHELSKEDAGAWQTGNLDLGKLADTLSDVDQITSKHERRDGPAFKSPAERRGLRALLQLLRLEIDVLHRIGNADQFVATLEPMVVQTYARRWAATLSDIDRLVDLQVPNSPYLAEKAVIEKAIHETAMALKGNRN